MKFFNFRRKNQVNEQLLPEVKSFTEKEHRERVGLAWIVGIISLVVMVGILTGLFYGGRWTYNKLTNNGNKSNTSEQSPAKTSNEDKDQKTESPIDNDSDQQGTATAPQVETAPSAETPTPATTPTTGPDLPRTGPDLDL